MNESRRMEWTGHVAHTEEIRQYYNILVGISGKKSLFAKTLM
jgi:hypothetical protein